MILLWFTIAECPFNVGCFSFYSIILGLRGTADSFLLLPWVPEPMLCQSLWGLVLSLFLIIFSFWCCLPKSPLLTFHSEVSLGSWPQLFGFFTFSNSVFGCPSSCHFSQVSGIHSCWADYQPLPLIVLHSGFPKVPPPLFMNCYSKPSGSPLRHWVHEKDTYVLRSLCFFGTLFELS